MEKRNQENNQSIEALNLDELETLWEKAKKWSDRKIKPIKYIQLFRKN
ncbi:MAG: hypothetical protein CM15mP117_22190 [Alphaproteobacteria bacterium]|nr:MAG: hypothetical protein CM15mP117_22190 [Alphaproteobacteria bacterium]